MLLFVFFIILVGGEDVNKSFVFTFATENKRIPFEKGDATALNSVFWFGLTAGRLAMAVACKFLSVPVIMGIVVAGNFVSSVVLGIWGLKIRWVIWAFIGKCIET